MTLIGSERVITMNIMKLLAAKANDNWNARPVTIAFLGDSVTQGCFEIYAKND